MWRKNDERRIEKFFERARQEPIPETLRARLQADVEARFPEPSPGAASNVWVRRKPILVAAAVALLLVFVLLGILLPIRRPPNLFAAVLDAMEQVKTAHITGNAFETWISVDHGVRTDISDGEIRVYTPETAWVYDPERNTVTLLDPEPDKPQQELATLAGAEVLTPLAADMFPGHYTVSDTIFEGRPAKQIETDIDWATPRPWATIWIDAETMRVVARKWWLTDKEGNPVDEGYSRVEYDVSIDPALFAIELPAGARVIDARLGDLRELIAEARQAAETRVVHEIREQKWELVGTAKGQTVMSFDCPSTRESWCLYGVGERYAWNHPECRPEDWSRSRPHSRSFYVRRGDTAWSWSLRPSSSTPRPARVFIENAKGDIAPDALVALDELKGYTTKLSRSLEIDCKERKGKPVAEIVRYISPDPNAKDWPKYSNTEKKDILVFELETKTLVESMWYAVVEGQWRLASHSTFEYLEEIPEGIFEPDPPPGAQIEDLRRD